MDRKRTKREKIEGIQDTLERHGRFNFNSIAYGYNWSMPDGDYKYAQPWYHRAFTGFCRTVLATFGRLLIKLSFGAKVDGKENLKALGSSGAITICNHFHFLDILFVRLATGWYKSFSTSAPFNNKKGIGGAIIRHGGIWPFSANVVAMRNLINEMGSQLKKGNRVHFNAEQSMWWNYQKPRPMKSGAFHYAVKFDVPVLPLFCTFKKSKRGGLKKLRIHILPAIYPNKSLPPKERESQMKATAEQMWKDTYESVYDRKLEYLSL